jgi:hypothetical protein
MRLRAEVRQAGAPPMTLASDGARWQSSAVEGEQIVYHDGEGVPPLLVDVATLLRLGEHADQLAVAGTPGPSRAVRGRSTHSRIVSSGTLLAVLPQLGRWLEVAAEIHFDQATGVILAVETAPSPEHPDRNREALLRFVAARFDMTDSV